MRVLRGPGLVSVHDDYHRGVEHRVARGHAGFHGQGVDERLHGGAHLPASLADVVILEIAVVGTAHIGFHMTGSRLDGHEGRPEEGLVVADGIVRSHHRVPVTGLLPGEHAHLGGLGETLVNLRLGMAGGLHHAGAVAPAASLLQGGFHHGGLRIGRERGVLPVFQFAEEGLLEVFSEMFGNGFLRITLHLVVDGGIDAKAVLVKVVLGAVALEILVEPTVEGVVGPQERIGLVVFDDGIGRFLGLLRAHDAAEHIPEIRAHAGGAVSLAGVQGDGKRLERIAFCTGDVIQRFHALQHHVAAAEGMFGIQGRIVAGGLVHHAHQHGALFREKLCRALSKELVGGR